MVTIMDTRKPFSFSASKNIPGSLKLVKLLKKYASNTGISFSFIVLKGLQLYKEQVIDNVKK